MFNLAIVCERQYRNYPVYIVLVLNFFLCIFSGVIYKEVFACKCEDQEKPPRRRLAHSVALLWSHGRHAMARYLSRAGLSLACLLLLLLWLALRSLKREALLLATTVFLREERRGCLYRQGLDTAGRLADNATYSRFFCGPRWQHPRGLCSVHRVVLRPERLLFEARVREEEVKEANQELAGLPWPLRATDEGWPQCARYVDEAFVFLVGDDHEEAPYYSLHVDTFLPLYSLLALRKHLGPPTNPGYTAAFLPAVEDYALQVSAALDGPE